MKNKNEYPQFLDEIWEIKKELSYEMQKMGIDGFFKKCNEEGKKLASHYKLKTAIIDMNSIKKIKKQEISKGIYKIVKL